MGVYLVAVIFGIPCFLFILWVWLTPRGKKWLNS